MTEEKNDGSDSRGESESSNSKTGRQEPPPTIVEWGMRGLSALALLVLFGFLVHGAMQPDVGPNFVFEVSSEKIEERRNGWAVPVKITNRGSVAVSEVAFEAWLEGDSDTPSKIKRGRIAIFGAKESVDTEIWFDDDPRGRKLQFRVDTYSL